MTFTTRPLFALALIATLGACATARAQFNVGVPIPAPPAFPVQVTPGGITYHGPGTQTGIHYHPGQLGGYHADPRGNGFSGIVRPGGPAPLLGGSYQSADGGRTSGYLSGNAGRFDQRDPSGARFGGGYQTQGQNFQANGYQYDQFGNGWNGGLARQGNSVGVHGEVRQQGYIPFTQDRIGGGAVIAGRDSRANGHYDVYDPIGRHKFGGMTNSLDRHQYTQGGVINVGPGRLGQQQNVDFAGINSRLGQTQQAHLPGVGTIYNHVGGDRRGIRADTGIDTGLGSVHVGVGVSGNGIRPQVSAQSRLLSQVTNTTTVMPHVQTPRVSMPRVSMPNLPTPRVSMPQVSMPRVSIPASPPPAVSGTLKRLGF